MCGVLSFLLRRHIDKQACSLMMLTIEFGEDIKTCL